MSQRSEPGWFHGVREPTLATLRRYGLTLSDWRSLWNSQGRQCPICVRPPPSGRIVTDHEHVRGWKRMPPEERKQYVRGLLCWTCNRDRVGRNDPVTAARVATYLIRYAASRDATNVTAAEAA